MARMRGLAAAEPDPWSRSLPLHFTASALVLHPGSGRVLLRWHQRLRMWLQAGGHADPGESDPLAIALREAAEETGLPDLVPWPDGGIKHVVVCHVPAGKGEPAHEHADLRYFMATGEPDAARPENPEAPLRWLTLAEARDLVGHQQPQAHPGPRGGAARLTGRPGLSRIAAIRSQITPDEQFVLFGQ